MGTTQDVASHQPLSQVEQIAPFIAASALPSAPLPAFLAKSLGPSELPSRSTPMTPRSSSDDPLSRKNPSVHPDSSTQVSSRRQIAALEISEEIIDGVPPFAITALPESILLDHDVKSQASREPSIASSRCPVRTRLLGRGPVFGRQKEILDPRIIVRQLFADYTESLGTFLTFTAVCTGQNIPKLYACWNRRHNILRFYYLANTRPPCRR